MVEFSAVNKLMYDKLSILYLLYLEEPEIFILLKYNLFSPTFM